MKECGYHFNARVTEVNHQLVGIHWSEKVVGDIPVTVVMNITCSMCPLKEQITASAIREANARSRAIVEGQRLVRNFCPEFSKV